MKAHNSHLTKSLVLASSLALLALPRAFANDMDSSSSFSAMDTDHDGRISQAEFLAADQQDNAKLDANNDGMVSADERAAAKPAKKHWWNRSDKSTDNANEATSAVQRFANLDTNHDGYLSQDECKAAGHDVKGMNK